MASLVCLSCKLYDCVCSHQSKESGSNNQCSIDAVNKANSSDPVKVPANCSRSYSCDELTKIEEALSSGYSLDSIIPTTSQCKETVQLKDTSEVTLAADKCDSIAKHVFSLANDFPLSESKSISSTKDICASGTDVSSSSHRTSSKSDQAIIACNASSTSQSFASKNDLNTISNCYSSESLFSDSQEKAIINDSYCDRREKLGIPFSSNSNHPMISSRSDTFSNCRLQLEALAILENTASARVAVSTNAEKTGLNNDFVNQINEDHSINGSGNGSSQSFNIERRMCSLKTDSVNFDSSVHDNTCALKIQTGSSIVAPNMFHGNQANVVKVCISNGPQFPNPMECSDSEHHHRFHLGSHCENHTRPTRCFNTSVSSNDERSCFNLNGDSNRCQGSAPWHCCIPQEVSIGCTCMHTCSQMLQSPHPHHILMNPNCCLHTSDDVVRASCVAHTSHRQPNKSLLHSSSNMFHSLNSCQMTAIHSNQMPSVSNGFHNCRANSCSSNAGACAHKCSFKDLQQLDSHPATDVESNDSDVDLNANTDDVRTPNTESGSSIQTKRSLKCKVFEKFYHRKNKSESSIVKKASNKKHSLPSWTSFSSRLQRATTSRFTRTGHNSPAVTSEAASGNLPSEQSSESCIATGSSEQMATKPIESNEACARDEQKAETGSSSSSTDEIIGTSVFDLMHERNNGGRSGSVPLPFVYNSVMELHLLLDRSLRLSLASDCIVPQERIAQHLERMSYRQDSSNSVASQFDWNKSYGNSPWTVHTQVDYIHCLVPDLLSVTNCSFYWGKMDRYEAETLLENRPEGTFLLRDSAQEEYLFSVSFRRYGKSLHARIEQGNHKFSFDSHDPGVFASETVCGLIEHYKDPSCCMFFEPMLTNPLCRTFPFPLQHLCRATICSNLTYDGINKLDLPKVIRNYLKEYHYKQLVRVRRLDH